MIVLGIETSCDETAASIVKDGRKILSNVVSSSLPLHKRFGGIVPEIASRAHLESINFVVKEALKKARKRFRDIDLIAVASTPGLVGSLLVGLLFAKSLSRSLKKPVLEINHIQAHLYACFFQKKNPKFPFIGLIISGGHTSLFNVLDFHSFKLLGTTLDDACGEAFDKVAKILNLGFPGGPIIDRLSKTARNFKIRFSYSQLPGSYNFSFSGIKTAVLYYVKKNQGRNGFIKSEVAACFQESVVNNLIEKSIFACKKKKINRLVLGGGVAANSRLRERLSEVALVEGIEVYLPERILCVDNAAMIAGLGYQIYKKAG